MSIIGSTTYTYAATTDFVFTINTANSGSSNSTSFTIPTTGSGYNYMVDWTNSGTPELVLQHGNALHDFNIAGIYTIRISGTFPSINFNGSGDAQKVVSIDQWGSSMAWASFSYAFFGCSNMTIGATDAPLLTHVTNLNHMFSNCNSLTTGNFNAWDVRTITDMGNMFYYSPLFNDNIGSWNTSAVTNMYQMFAHATAFNNLGSSTIGNWNTAVVQNMYYMFNATAFNQNIGKWPTTAVTNMAGMFQVATAFNQDISSWNTAAVTNMSAMFAGASAFNQNINTTNTNSWNTAAVTSMSYMFQNALAFNQNIGSWNTAAVTNMTNMFQNASQFNQNIGSWNIAKVTNMTDMLSNTGMGITNYDLTLISWQAGPHPTGISFTATGLQYCASAVQHGLLKNNNGWTFSDTYLYASTVPTLVAANTLVATSNATCTDATGYQQFLNSLSAPTAKYIAINPNGYTGYSFAVTSANNIPAINNQHIVSGQNTTALGNRMYTVVDAGTDNYPSGMTVRIYYLPADTTAAIAALASSSNPLTSQWFKISGTSHAANIATILANQTANGITGATFLVPSARGTEGGINYVEFSGITTFSTFGYLAAKTNSTILPITLASFKGIANGCTANLSWQSATESNSNYYAVEEGSDGSNFTQVAKLNSGNSASGAAYTHAFPLQGGTSYFRLKMVDLDGQFGYSPTVAIVGTGACSTGTKATISPNPTRDVVNIAGLPIGSIATLYDMNGKKTHTLLATATTATINLQAFANGIYMLQKQNADGTMETLKIVKQ